MNISRQPVSHHVYVLDGLRAASIILVLWTHLFPAQLFGIKFNASIGVLGMALFFVLSGYLITSQILRGMNASTFLMRRVARVVPAAWLCLTLVYVLQFPGWQTAIANYLFVANLPPQELVKPLDHFWSLCVEIQFYALVAVLIWWRPRLIWFAFPSMLLAISLIRWRAGVTATSITWYRADDLMAGACLALLGASSWWSRMEKLAQVPFVLPILWSLLPAACFLPQQGENPMAYFRPYAAAASVGALMVRRPDVVTRILQSRGFVYVASISYALYIWHLPLAATWLGSGGVVEKYAKRPLLLGVLLVVAHVSTFYFERWFTDRARRLT